MTCAEYEVVEKLVVGSFACGLLTSTAAGAMAFTPIPGLLQLGIGAAFGYIGLVALSKTIGKLQKLHHTSLNEED